LFGEAGRKFLPAFFSFFLIFRLTAPKAQKWILTIQQKNVVAIVRRYNNNSLNRKFRGQKTFPVIYYFRLTNRKPSVKSGHIKHQTRRIKMNSFEAKTLANQLIQQFGLVGWTFKINSRAKTRLGCCKYFRTGTGGIIELSAWCLNGGVVEGKAEDTIRHEIAHAIAGPGSGHGPKWRQACRLTGANPQVCASAEVINNAPKPKYKLICTSCHKVLAERHRRSDFSQHRTRCCKADLAFRLN
jgi:hypothetical protein